MKLIVGLGNPGKEYINTRHNIGFMVIDRYLGDVKFKEKFNGLFYEINSNGEKIIFVKPQTFMNNSGECVGKFVKYYNVTNEDIMVIQDDLDIIIGNIKFKINSSSGGHNGIRDIERCLGTREYARVKIGIANNKKVDTRDYVLGNFSGDENEILRKNYELLSSVVDDFCLQSLDRLMSKYNHKKF